MMEVISNGYSKNLRVYLATEPGLVRKYQNGGLLQNCLCATVLLLWLLNGFEFEKKKKKTHFSDIGQYYACAKFEMFSLTIRPVVH